MQDRPTSDELLAAIEHFLDTEIVPNVPGARGFHARVSANSIRIIRRELQMEHPHLAAEWSRLDAILGAAEPPSERAALRSGLIVRNEALVALIRQGGADEGPTRSRIFEHVRDTVRDKLTVTNPELLTRSEPASESRP